MKVRPTLRADGAERVVIRVAHHLTRADLVSLLAGWAAVYGNDDELTEAGVWDTLRQHLTNEGRDAVHALALANDVHDAEELTAWAAAQVARIWPENSSGAGR